MKIHFFFLLLGILFFTIASNAQIPNGGFENWESNGNPVGWWTNNAPGVYTTITKSSDAFSGSWAVEGNVATVSGIGVGPAIISGVEGLGIPINFRPAAITGYYKFTSINGDYMQVQADFLKSGVGGVGVGAANLNPAASYTQFSIDINYITGDMPDTVLIAVFIVGNGGFPNVGSKMFVDDLVWGNSSDVKELGNEIPDVFALMQNYPNPFNPSTTIRYAIPEESFTSIKVYDMLGNEVSTLVNEEQSAGIYETDFNSDGLSSGMYFYTLKAGNYIETKKMLLLK